VWGPSELEVFESVIHKALTVIERCHFYIGMLQTAAEKGEGTPVEYIAELEAELADLKICLERIGRGDGLSHE
jgi:hypothetical protein